MTQHLHNFLDKLEIKLSILGVFMKKNIFGIAAAAILATSSFGADYVMKISHVVSSSTPKGMAADFLEKELRS